MTSPLRVFANARIGLVMVVAAWVPAIALAQPAASGPPAVVQSVDAAPLAGAAGSAVTVRAAGPLPLPVVGVLDGPPRIYLDFAGVRLPSGVTAAWHDSRLRGVRLAQHTKAPLVLRVVIDLRRPTTYRIDASGRAGGTIVVLLGEQAPGPPVSPPQAGRSRDAERYLRRVSMMLARLHALRPLIVTIDGRGAAPDGDLSAAAAELDSLGRALAAMKVPESLATTHDVLMRSCALGARALIMRRDAHASGDAQAARNAGSAAAGALMLLDRATRDLGYVPPP